MARYLLLALLAVAILSPSALASGRDWRKPTRTLAGKAQAFARPTPRSLLLGLGSGKPSVNGNSTSGGPLTQDEADALTGEWQPQDGVKIFAADALLEFLNEQYTQSGRVDVAEAFAAASNEGSDANFLDSYLPTFVTTGVDIETGAIFLVGITTEGTGFWLGTATKADYGIEIMAYSGRGDTLHAAYTSSGELTLAYTVVPKSGDDGTLLTAGLAIQATYAKTSNSVDDVVKDLYDQAS